jgi:site-specific recombinase XerD
MNIKTLIEKFYSYAVTYKGYSKETIRRFENVLSTYCKLYAIHSPGDITVQNVQDLFYVGRTTRKWTTNTFHVYHKSLMVFFRWCKENGYILTNPIEHIPLPKLEKRLPKKLTKQEAFILLEIIDNYPHQNSFLRYRNYAIFATFIYAGLRKSELLNIKYADIDIENLTIFVRQGKGAKDRIIPICQALKVILLKYIMVRQKLHITCPSFFTSSVQNSGLTVLGLKYFHNNLRRAFGSNFTIHQLRHTFATLMIEGGCDIYSLSKMMGHAQITTTTIYLSASVEHLRTQISKHPMDALVL